MLFWDTSRIASCKHQHIANHSQYWCSRNRPCRTYTNWRRDFEKLMIVIKLKIFAIQPKPFTLVSFAMQREKNWKRVNFSSPSFPTVESSYEPVEDAFPSCQLCNAQSASFITILHTILLSSFIPSSLQSFLQSFIQSFLPPFVQSFLPSFL